jgi:ribonuclease-3
MKQVEEFLKLQKIQPRKLDLYQLAFTHTSVNVSQGSIGKDYERLEFIGDAFISMVVAQLVFQLHPDWSQGDMSKTRAKFVQTDSLCNIAKRLNIADYITIGHSITRTVVAESKKILEDVFEAWIGALFLDLGYTQAYKYVSDIFYQDILNVQLDDLTDYKTRLQEEMQAEFREAVSYEYVNEEGPAHDKIFTVKVSFNGMTLGMGKGSSKKAAEQAAAKEALLKKATL